MKDDPAAALAANVNRFDGLSGTYDAHRPQPPQALLDVLVMLAGGGRPKLVVDLGSGTGLSTRVWAGHAERVIGIEPGDDMRRVAMAQTAADNVSYRAGASHATGLPDQCADIVTCSQSLHWMEPASTFREARRILRPGGVFAAYDCDWPQTSPHWQLEAASLALNERVDALCEKLGIEAKVARWAKEGHLARLRASGAFRFAKEIAIHSVDTGDAARWVGLELSKGSVGALLKRGLSEDEIGLTAFRETVRRVLGNAPETWYWTYRVRYGIV